jgi:hypothetical protein
MKHYDSIKLGTFLFTWSKPLDAEQRMTTVDLNDPSLPDDLVEINPDADAFTRSTDNAE